MKGDAALVFDDGVVIKRGALEQGGPQPELIMVEGPIPLDAFSAENFETGQR